MSVSREIKQKVLKDADFCCHYCAQAASTVDHVIPQAHGGGDSRSNLVAACFPCNNERGTFPYEIWRRFIRRFGPLPEDWKRQNTNLYRVIAVEKIVSNAGIEKAVEVLMERFGRTPDETLALMNRYANRADIRSARLDRIFSDLVGDYRHFKVDVSSSSTTMDSLR
ncbi:HNH endonuclease [compost metagenome]